MGKKEKFIFGVFIVFILLIGIFIGLNLSSSKDRVVKEKEIVFLNNGKEIKINIVGVNKNNTGVPGELITKIRPGSGEVLVNINDVLTGELMQYSARVAVSAAEYVTNKSLDNLDISYSIKSIGALSIDGPSAGSAMAVATIALLEDKKLRNDVVISGSINEQGVLESVAGVEAKAKAAKSINISLFLIPESADINEKYKREKICGALNGEEYCEIKNIAKEIDLAIKVKKIKDIKEALNYFYEN